MLRWLVVFAIIAASSVAAPAAEVAASGHDRSRGSSGYGTAATLRPGAGGSDARTRGIGANSPRFGNNATSGWNQPGWGGTRNPGWGYSFGPNLGGSGR
jgi:hypothetical protein